MIDYEALWQAVLNRPYGMHPGRAFVEAYEAAKAGQPYGFAKEVMQNLKNSPPPDDAVYLTEQPNDCRAAFENRLIPNLNLKKNELGGYYYEAAIQAFRDFSDGWKAARATMRESGGE